MAATRALLACINPLVMRCNLVKHHQLVEKKKEGKREALGRKRSLLIWIDEYIQTIHTGQSSQISRKLICTPVVCVVRIQIKFVYSVETCIVPKLGWVIQDVLHCITAKALEPNIRVMIGKRLVPLPLYSSHRGDEKRLRKKERGLVEEEEEEKTKKTEKLIAN
jgi:hypothetical protein